MAPRHRAEAGSGVHGQEGGDEPNGALDELHSSVTFSAVTEFYAKEPTVYIK